MRRLVLALISAAAFVVAPVAYPCDCGGCPPTTCGTSATAPPGSGLLLVRTFGRLGPLKAYDVDTGRLRFSLPAGVVSADGRRFFSFVHARLRAYDGRSGRPLHAWPQTGWRVAGVSANGRVVALIRSSSRAKLTRIMLVGERGRVLRRITLHGFFDVDGVANDGRRLFLIQYKQNGYLVRAYDVARRALAQRPLTEKGLPMQGTAWNAVASPDGRYLLTLFLRGDGDAEVHTLDLARGTAVCIDLPGGDPYEVQQYALALAPDGRILYAANPALGVVVRVDLATKRVVNVDRFPRDAASGVQSSTGALSRNGRTVYFTSGRKVYGYDTAYGRVRGPYRTDAVAIGVAFSTDGHRLLVVGSNGTATYLDAATGRKISSRL
jgi:sugar lactone lactonase YvrE